MSEIHPAASAAAGSRRKVDILHLRSRLPAWVGYLAWKSLPERLRPKLVTTFHGFYSVNAYSAVMAQRPEGNYDFKRRGDHIRQRYRVRRSGSSGYSGGSTRLNSVPGRESGHVAFLRESWNLDEDSGPVVMLPGR